MSLQFSGNFNAYLNFIIKNLIQIISDSYSLSFGQDSIHKNISFRVFESFFKN